ncbi:MAG: hypothetical protein IJK98_11735 [Clostridia bacterium]|nr:hypothetical protein [Clostridia bacterium]
MRKTLQQTIAVLITVCLLAGSVPLYAAAQPETNDDVPETGISGDVRTSELPDSIPSLELAGDTVLTLDEDRHIGQFRLGEYSLAVNGDHALTVDLFLGGSITLDSGTVYPYYAEVDELNINGGLMEPLVSSDEEYGMPRAVSVHALNVTGGELRVCGEWNSGLSARIIRISGGSVTVQTSSHAIQSISVTVSGGELHGVARGDGLSTYDGIWGMSESDIENGDAVLGLTVTGGTVELRGTHTGASREDGWSIGMYMPAVSVTGGKLEASGSVSAINCAQQIVLGEGMEIAEPEGAYAAAEPSLQEPSYGWTGYSILKKDGSRAASVIIQPAAAPVIDSENVKEKDENVFVASGMAAAELLALAGDGASITKADGAALTEKETVGSGMTLTKSDGSALTVIVKGDNTGDGKIGSEDARLALRASVSLEAFAGWQTAASLVDNGEKVTSADARLILRASVNLEKLSLV